MWLRVITVDELAEADGACVSPEKLDGRLRNDSTHLWPNILRPSEKMFEILDVCAQELMQQRETPSSKQTSHP